MAQLFPPVATTLARAGLLGGAALLLGGLGLLVALPFTPHVTRQDVTVEQPVQFSHAHHVGGLGLDCRNCHTGAERSRFAGLPPTQTCMACHSQLWTNAAILAPVRESLARDVPLRWVRVHRLPDYVYFDHSIHVAKGVGCSTCHGAVDRMQQLRQAAPLTMGWCLDCHRDPAPNLRPREAVYDMRWTPPPDQRARGEALIRDYMIRTEHLTDCSRCHR
ncbi:cytochrome c family protein [Roseomonas sp. OT10]|uniref:cytochrome c3 family protein n=1 Tax=Roseomonas cutis TaxID=2897332 RepID=UPI001E5D98E3|nr:cytochrome c3 family protein [Roseomonas sp. OT10]UFN46932.1 cytochrome c family protein [Roseomonas sp. OT10]